MATPSTGPVLSTPDSHILEEAIPKATQTAFPALGEDELYKVYEVERTVGEILAKGFHRIALQFPDDMLRDAPRVAERLQQKLSSAVPTGLGARDSAPEEISNGMQRLSIDCTREDEPEVAAPFKVTILADTSYGACCVDEIAAEHVDAEVVVHYGRTCLSPTARLPVIYVYTVKSMDIDSAVDAIGRSQPDLTSKLILLADLPYHGHVAAISSKLQAVGYSNLFAPSIKHDPASLIPNRTVPPEVEDSPEALENYSIYHVAEPPDSLLLILSSRVKSINILPVNDSEAATSETFEASATHALRRRYALVAKLSTVPIFGILINTLSVKNYMSVLQHVKDLITNAGKKYYTFVVGKVNAAKVANFSEVGGWVVIGCWESSLIESKDFWKPIITPFELKLALTHERDRIWTGAWDSNFQAILDGARDADTTQDVADATEAGVPSAEESDDESAPPEFDLRTGRYVSHSRPMARSGRAREADGISQQSTSLIKRGGQDLAQIGGEVSPAAEFLRSKRTWQGLGSDREISYQYDTEGRMQGAQMEEGRSGIARGYAVGEDPSKT
ncbi:diphthamide biosynthesis protein 2 [Sphaceloma murrayae]|uniref:2-(3-amino-3-carboxypropyl)histidine synthase subunit 2 n=1 Tax=Sphaceloma murrayae TaxID=2082308 RepID=A0A2K1R352_9PEZI|nr:diphthamide biosynthesis protein 2 [Sphaceloma murrayae]